MPGNIHHIIQINDCCHSPKTQQPEATSARRYRVRAKKDILLVQGFVDNERGEDEENVRLLRAG